MLIKSIKHDLIATYRDFAGLYTSLLVLSIVGPFMLTSKNDILFRVLFLGSFGLAIATIVVTFITIIKLVSRRLFSEEGYLTLTLPVSTYDTVLSKVITAMVWFIATVTVFIVTVTIFSTITYFLLRGYNWDQPTLTLWHLIYQFVDSGAPKVILSAIAVGTPLNLIDIFSSFMVLVFIITLINTSWIRKYRVPAGVVLYFAINIALNTLMPYLYHWPIIFNNMNIVVGSEAAFSTVSNVFSQIGFTVNWTYYAIGVAAKGIISVGLCFATVWLIEHKLEIE